ERVVAEADAAVLALRLLHLGEDAAGRDGLLRPRLEDARPQLAQGQVLPVSGFDEPVELRVLEDVPPLVDLALLDMGVAALDPVRGHGRGRAAVVGPDLEAVVDPVQRAGRDAPAAEQGDADEAGPRQPAGRAPPVAPGGIRPGAGCLSHPSGPWSRLGR